jgi:hypothetical protein
MRRSVENAYEIETLEGEDRRLDSSDVTKLVATGYDQIADIYLQQQA